MMRMTHIEEAVLHFGKCTFLLSFQELDEMVKTTFIPVRSIQSYSHKMVSLA